MCFLTKDQGTNKWDVRIELKYMGEWVLLYYLKVKEEATTVEQVSEKDTLKT